MLLLLLLPFFVWWCQEFWIYVLVLRPPQTYQYQITQVALARASGLFFFDNVTMLTSKEGVSNG